MRNDIPILLNLGKWNFENYQTQIYPSVYDKPEMEIFPDGERYHNLKKSDISYGKKVLIVSSTSNDQEFLDLYDVAYTAIQMGAKHIHIFIPYFGYQTMERGKTYEAVKAKTRAHILSSLPQSSCRIDMSCIDLHTDGIPYYFNIPVRHLSTQDLIIKHVESTISTLGYRREDCAIAAPDFGRMKVIDSISRILNMPTVFVSKRRTSGDTTEVIGGYGDPSNKHLFMFDDLVRTGGTLASACALYKEHGCLSNNVIITHADFPSDHNRLNKFKSALDSNIIDNFYVTDTNITSIYDIDGFFKKMNIVNIVESFAVDILKKLDYK